MNKWDELKLSEKAQLLGIYASKGYTDLASIISHYNSYQTGGTIENKDLGKITPLGQWEYPNQVTTIPSNNITMKGVNYPVIGVSNTGDTKYMLPNMDYLFEGQYVTEYPVNNYQEGGLVKASKSLYATDEPTSLHAAHYDLNPVQVTAKSSYTLNDFQKAQLNKYGRNEDGTLNDWGKRYVEEQTYNNTHNGPSRFMKDVNKIGSTLNKVAIASIAAPYAAAGIYYGGRAALPVIKSMANPTSIATMMTGMAGATAANQYLSDATDGEYNNVTNFALNKLADAGLDINPNSFISEELADLDLLNPGWFLGEATNVGARSLDKAASAALNTKVAPVLADALYKNASFSTDPIMQMVYRDYIGGKSSFGNIFPQKTIQTGLDDNAMQLLRNRTLNRDIKAIEEDPTLGFLGENRIKKLNEIFDKDLPNIKVGKYSGRDYKNAGYGDYGGFYDEGSQFISINEDSGMPIEKIQAHEGLHHIDSKHSLTVEQDAALNKAFDDDFNTLPETEYAPEYLKGYTHMHKERITTNRDARDELLGYEDMPLEKQNKIIDQATDDAIFSAVENANGYGRAYIRRLRAENKLTHEKANAFRESMKKVGVITGIIGTGAAALQK